MFKYRIDKSQRIIFTNVAGSISVFDVMAHFKNVLSDPDFSPNFHSIATIDDNTKIPYGSSENVALMREVLEGFAQRRKGTKWAIITSGETMPALIKYSLDLVGPVSSEIRIFRNMNDALEWINDKK
jgi:hypothetical protein